MWRTLSSRIQGNSRVCLQFETMFLVPYVLVTTYATVYMYKIGLDETQIGWLTTIGLIVQVFSAFASGFLTDRLGRRHALLYFDILSWLVPFAFLIFAHNIWFFLIAVVFNGLVRIPHTAFSCLLVEDTPKEHRPAVFMVLQFILVIAGLLAPIGGLLVAQFGEVLAIRVMYGMAFLFIGVMIFWRHHILKESDISIRKKHETRNVDLKANWHAYKQVTIGLFKNRSLLLIFAVFTLTTFQITLSSIYLSLYFIDYLQIDSAWISIFPAFTSMTMLVLMIFIVPRIPSKLITRWMMGGFLISLVGIVLLIFAPPHNIIVLVGITIVLAAGKMFTDPYLESVVANEMNDNDRANSLANLWVIVLLVTAPSGVIGGWAYHLDARLPFVLIALSFLICMVLMVMFHKKTNNRLVDAPPLAV